MAIGEYGEAEKQLRIALELVPNDPISLRALGQVLENKGDLVAARAAYRRAAFAMASTSRLDTSLEMVDHALDLEPDDSEALVLKGLILRSLA